MDLIFESLVSLLAFWPAVLVLIGLGIAGLKYGADALVTGSANIGFRLGITATMIGLTIVAFGTSAPELVVSIQTAMADNPTICLGNVIGSNIANSTLILGAAAMIFPMSISKRTIQQDGPLNIAAIGLVLALSILGQGLSRLDGIILVVAFSVWMGWLIRKSMHQAAASRQRRDSNNGDGDVPHFHRRSIVLDVALILIGLIALVIGARALVRGAIETAVALNISEMVISLTIVAGGTSLPELAVSVMAALKKHDDISVGNIMGSNIFNVLLILGIAVCIAPISFAQDSGNRAPLLYDIPICVGTGVLLLALVRNRKLGRLKGALLTATYLAFLGFLAIRQIG